MPSYTNDTVALSRIDEISGTLRQLKTGYPLQQGLVTEQRKVRPAFSALPVNTADLTNPSKRK